MMKQKEAEYSILHVWLNLKEEEKHDAQCGLKLYDWLNQNRPDLLLFRFSGDKYQKINGWVLNWQNRHPRKKL